MFEALESRQLFSVALTTAATEPTADSPTPAAIDADGTSLSVRGGTDGQQEYLIIKLKPVYITSYQT
jgi:hypothetical protein